MSTRTSPLDMIPLAMVCGSRLHFWAGECSYSAPSFASFQSPESFQNWWANTSWGRPGCAEGPKGFHNLISTKCVSISKSFFSFIQGSGSGWLVQMKNLNKFEIQPNHNSVHNSISTGSLGLLLCEVIVLMCTSNLQNMSSKLLLEVGEPKFGFSWYIVNV